MDSFGTVLRGVAGHNYVVQESARLGSLNWISVLSHPFPSIVRQIAA